MRDPDKTGRVAKAWRARVDHDNPANDNPANASHVVSWVVHGPFHPAWSYWYVGAVDLIDRPGIDPPHRQYPEAEHEILILSLDPECYPPDPDAQGGLRFLQPADLVYQLDGLPREKVEEIVALIVSAIVEGKASPDSDYRSWWESALDTTVRHYKEGKH